MATRRQVVLLVEDDHEMAAVLAELLRDEGLAAVVAPSGARALAALGELQVDAVLLDYHLPDMSGAAFAAAYRASPGLHAPLILTTADYRPEELAAAVGADALLPKPFDVEDLLATLRRFLEERRRDESPDGSSEGPPG